MEREEVKQHLNNIVGNIASIQTSVKGLSYNEFTENEYLREQVYEDLQQIGQAAQELANRGPDMVQNEDSVNRLTQLKFARYNQTIEVDHHNVWSIIQQDLPEIGEEIEQSAIYARS